ncbi:MAG: hypothetical protein ACXABY_27735 [Candidatus Thorarchaeota archaeon]|jgi:hypothetical protein
MAIIESIKDLVLSFDSDHGHNEEVYNATYNLIGAVFGPASARVFSSKIDATNGDFYLKTPGVRVWHDIVTATE